jgi:hypothetical protein
MPCDAGEINAPGQDTATRVACFAPEKSVRARAVMKRLACLPGVEAVFIPLDRSGENTMSGTALVAVG